jgi:3-isopropylmalate/(R)-2-methylmalate dehydratase small subunit
MQPFKSHRGIVATLDRANIDTDAIIPKQFLKSIKRIGFGEALFFDWRYLPDGKPNYKFELNAPRMKGASILVTRNNFGCGSSREHAVWAIVQYGFKVVIAPWLMRDGTRIQGFADIFKSNSVKNGLLTVELAESEVEEIFQKAARFKGMEATVDLDEQRVVLNIEEEVLFHFDIEPGMKEHLLRGLDEIGLTIEREPAIKAFESKHDVQMPARK